MKKIAATHDVTLYMALLAVYTILLSKLSGQEDIIVGTPTAGRRHADLQNIVGMFINTLAIRNYPKGEKNVDAYLGEVGESAIQAFENQEYPFEELVEKLELRKDTGRNPLFDTMFSLQNIEVQNSENTKTDKPETDNTALKLIPHNFENTIAKFDLSFTAIEGEDTLYIALEYCTHLFKGETLERFGNYFKQIIHGISTDPGIKISGLEIITEEEKRLVLEEFNRTATPYPKDKTIHQLFEEQVERTPEKISIVGGIHESPLQQTTQLTYRELNEKSNSQARLLQERGVKPGDIVGIMVDRSIEMIIGILSILKAGAAYLPIAPGYPGERINYMLKDSNVKIVLKEIQECDKSGQLDEGIETIDIHTMDKLTPPTETRQPASG
ncbi:MAG: AMP-binding protein, partial [bacterium]|nr:AMP-binding protein [bacterium]